LQAAGIGRGLLPFIAEVNEDKFFHFTPGTGIPIIDEKSAKLMNPDGFLVLPWHFRAGIVRREEEYLAKGGKLIFPLPVLEVVKAHKEVRGKVYETRRPWPLPDGGKDAYEMGN
jgi:hypothetical protein